jgi:hypothetical protein
VAAMEGFAKQQQIPVVQFRKGQRKDEVIKEHLARFGKPEGVVFIGKAQEKTPVFRTEKRRNPQTGPTYPWIVGWSRLMSCCAAGEAATSLHPAGPGSGYRYDVSILTGPFMGPQPAGRVLADASPRPTPERMHARVYRPVLAEVLPNAPPCDYCKGILPNSRPTSTAESGRLFPFGLPKRLFR